MTPGKYDIQVIRAVETKGMFWIQTHKEYGWKYLTTLKSYANTTIVSEKLFILNHRFFLKHYSINYSL